ncbi:Cac2p [Rhodotorula paludigena]|uniref:Cac2p n=1 Tax=Rhodotorula paludigena TaxID=86838 RepID=UPI0031829693
MKCKALEIRWHDTKPIFSADFHRVQPSQHLKPAHPYAKLAATGLEQPHDPKKEARDRDRADRDKVWRLATCGGDNLVRLWLVTPRPPPAAPSLTLPANPSAAASSSSKQPAPPQLPKQLADPDPKVDYLATLSQHTGVVNCVRFAPHGEVLATAGDDGNILIWVPGESSKKIGETDEDRAYERESWRVSKMIRSMSGKEIYDLAWSPSGDRLLAGSVDHTATIYDLLSGSPLYKIAEHTNYVQGVCWDPLGGYIATQSSDRSMHVYEVRDEGKAGATKLEVHPVGKNSRMEVQRPRAVHAAARRSSSLSRVTAAAKKASAPSSSNAPPANAEAGTSAHPATTDDAASTSVTRPTLPHRASSIRSDVSSSTAAATEITTSMDPPSGIPHHPPPRSTTAGGASSHSRRSSTSGSQPSQSPRLTPTSSSAALQRPLRSPSPAPLPAVMVPLSPKLNPVAPSAAAASTSASSSQDAAGPSGAAASTSDAANVNESVTRTETIKLYGDANSTPFFRRLTWSTDGSLLLTPAGLWEDPYAIAPSATTTAAGTGKKESKKDKAAASTSGASEARPTVYIYSRSNVARPPVAHLPGHKTTSIGIRFCPVLWDLREVGSAAADDAADVEGEEPALSVELGSETRDVPLYPGEKGKGKAAAGAGAGAGAGCKPKSLFDLPYRMVYAVATLDSVYLYDTQQVGPLAMFGNLHYAPFTDLTWSPDGQTLVISSQDGYCSIVAFEPGELGTPYHTQHPHLHLPHAHVSHQQQHAPADPSGEKDDSKDKGALEAYFAKPAAAHTAGTASASSSSAAAATAQPAGAESEPSALDLTSTVSSPAASAAAGASKKRDGADDVPEGAQPPPDKKQKKRVAPTLVKPLGS